MSKVDARNRIDSCFESLRESGKKGLVTYITAGYPGLSETVELAIEMAGAGADLIELGFHFSDPLADGPVIQKASQLALQGGANVRGVLRAVAEIRKSTGVPLILMTYYNPVYRFGLEEFAKEAALAGVDGLIVPDLPLEESFQLLQALDRYGICLIPLVAPTTTDRRLDLIASHARGFVYCVSVTGVTGYQPEITTDMENFTGRVRRATGLPVAIGFGIADREGAARMARFCDAVVVGTAIVRLITSGGGAAEVARLVRELKTAI
ncbi:MAG: tryptophan synthase subunit alpha [Eubacteriales bacterium]